VEHENVAQLFQKFDVEGRLNCQLSTGPELSAFWHMRVVGSARDVVTRCVDSRCPPNMFSLWARGHCANIHRYHYRGRLRQIARIP
jgi:hypothetical protein